jgi:hypothetical protein
MKLTKENTDQIKLLFNSMKSKDDFVELLNYTKEILYKVKSHQFTVKQINFYCNPKLSKNRYITFSIKKKSGAERIIHAPSNGLKAIQKCLNVIFQVVYEVNPSATGFLPGKSIVDNAKIHAGSYYVYNIDLKDFFPSIDAGRIWSRMQHPPFNLNEKSGRKELANVITWLCCTELEVERLINNEWKILKKKVLPQGAPTSPTLSNIICQRLDFYLSATAKRFGLRYTRYADDITFSSLHNVFHPGSGFLNEINRIILQENFHIKESKTRLQKTGYRQEVTGLIVNEKVNVQQRYIKQLRLWLHRWEIFGYEKAAIYFDKEYSNKVLPNSILRKENKRFDRWNVKEFTYVKGKKRTNFSEMENIIQGKLNYLKMVKGESNEMYLKLRQRFEALISQNISDIIDIWEKNGIENAMQVFYLKEHLNTAIKTNSKLNFEKGISNQSKSFNSINMIDDELPESMIEDMIKKSKRFDLSKLIFKGKE